MQILVKLATVILPSILNFVSKHESEILDKLFKKFAYGNSCWCGKESSKG